jgi:hypothetical protein
MLLRRIYTLLGWLVMVLGAFFFVSGLINGLSKGDFSTVFLGLVFGAFAVIGGFIIRTFALGPAEAGISYLGVDEKADLEKAASLVRKPQKVAAK